MEVIDLFINFDEKIIDKIVKELIDTKELYNIDYCEDDIVNNVYEELELWIAEYGLLDEIVDKVIKKLENNNVEIFKDY